MPEKYPAYTGVVLSYNCECKKFSGVTNVETIKVGSELTFIN